MNAVAGNPGFALPKQVQAQVDAAEARTVLRPVHGHPENAPAPVPDPAPAAVATEKPAEYWKSRFYTLEGVLKKRSSDFKERLSAQNVTITALQEKVASLERTAKLEKIDPTAYLSRDVIDEMGGATVARDTLRGAAKLVDELHQRPAAPSPAPAAVDERAEYLQVLDHLVPAWPQYNADPRWLAWLAEGGNVRQRVLDGHAAAQDAVSIASMFEEWLDAVNKPAPVTPPIGVVNRSGTGSDATPAPSPQPTGNLPPLTNQYIKDMYARAGRGQITDAQFQAFKQRLVAERGVKNP